MENLQYEEIEGALLLTGAKTGRKHTLDLSSNPLDDMTAMGTNDHDHSSNNINNDFSRKRDSINLLAMAALSQEGLMSGTDSISGGHERPLKKRHIKSSLSDHDSSSPTVKDDVDLAASLWANSRLADKKRTSETASAFHSVTDGSDDQPTNHAESPVMSTGREDMDDKAQAQLRALLLLQQQQQEAAQPRQDTVNAEAATAQAQLNALLALQQQQSSNALSDNETQLMALLRQQQKQQQQQMTAFSDKGQLSPNIVSVCGTDSPSTIRTTLSSSSSISAVASPDNSQDRATASSDDLMARLDKFREARERSKVSRELLAQAARDMQKLGGSGGRSTSPSVNEENSIAAATGLVGGDNASASLAAALTTAAAKPSGNSKTAASRLMLEVMGKGSAASGGGLNLNLGLSHEGASFGLASASARSLGLSLGTTATAAASGFGGALGLGAVASRSSLGLGSLGLGSAGARLGLGAGLGLGTNSSLGLGGTTGSLGLGTTGSLGLGTTGSLGLGSTGSLGLGTTESTLRLGATGSLGLGRLHSLGLGATALAGASASSLAAAAATSRNSSFGCGSTSNHVADLARSSPTSASPTTQLHGSNSFLGSTTTTGAW